MLFGPRMGKDAGAGGDGRKWRKRRKRAPGGLIRAGRVKSGLEEARRNEWQMPGEAVNSLLFCSGAGRHLEARFEMAREVALICEAEVVGDFGNALSAQQALAAFVEF